MLLDKLELFGFKSFAQRTTLRFAPGITAVVGPNGCGKSNISDAIRWALGEQNVRNLRGTQLEDVIFKGTREVKPMGAAEVSLHLDNRDQRLATEYGDVLIQRRAFRSGESEFRINKTACRLKDIRDLFLDTGLGSAEYAVIEREMIDEVLADRDSARRFLLDEAAGITRYKMRRKETVRKLEAVDADLVRVDDALEIEEREVRSLAYQMGKAKRHRRLTERIRDLDVSLARLRWRELTEAASGGTGRLTEETERRERLRAEGHALEARQEQARVDLLALDQQAQAARARLTECEDRLGKARSEALVLEERLRALEERIEDRAGRIATLGEAKTAAEARLSEVAAGLNGLCERLAESRARAGEAGDAVARVDGELRKAKDELTGRQQLQLEHVRERAVSEHRLQSLSAKAEDLGRLAGEVGAQSEHYTNSIGELAAEIERLIGRREEREREEEAGGNERRAIEAAAGEIEARLQELDGGLSARESEIAGLESRVRLLEEQARSHHGYQEAVARLLAEGGSLPGLIGVMAEQVTIDASWRERLAPALRTFTEWMITSTEEDAWQAIDWLKERGLGQVTFFPIDLPAPAPGAVALPEGALTARRPEHQALVEYLRSAIVPVADRSAVPPLASREPGRLWVTEAGEVLSAAGWVSAGGPVSEARLWARADEIEESRVRIAALAAEAAAMRDERARGVAERQSLAARARTLAEDAEARRAELSHLGRALAERQAEERMMRAEIERLAAEMATFTRQREEALRELEGSRESQQRTVAAESSADEDLRAAAAVVERFTAEKDALTKVLTEKRMEEIWAETRLREAQSQRADLERQITESIEGMAAMEAECESGRAQIEEGKKRLTELKREEGESLEQREGRVQEVDRVGRERTRLEDGLASIEQELRQTRRSLSELEDLLREDQVGLTRIEAEKERLRDRILEQYRCDLRELEEGARGGEGRAAGAQTASDGELSEEALGGENADGENADAVEGKGSGRLDGPSPLPSPEEALADRTPEQALEKLAELRLERDRLGPVNLLAIEEHEKKREHVRFIRAQREDLVRSRESLMAAIERINVEARRLFSETFAKVQENFDTTFGTLFPGGEARVQLSGEDPLEADIEIVARPRGKRLENIRLLSSGERTLTATALLFAVYLVKPSPFCVLDELDAPLDDANIERFVALLRKFSAQTQFIVITHNKLTMSIADALYGVTMQEPGISKIVSVRLEEGRLVSTDAEANQLFAQMNDA